MSGSLALSRVPTRIVSPMGKVGSSKSNQLLQVRDPNDYPDSLKFVLNLTTINEVPKVVGSASYLQHKYPGDVDVFEQVVVKGDRESSLNYYLDQFRTIAQELVLTRKEVIFNEFKAGFDPRFEFSDEMSTPQQRKEFVLGLCPDPLNESEAKSLAEKANNWYDFSEGLRKFGALRWSLTEIIDGIKTHRGKTYNLREALAMNSVVKLDAISWIEGRFQSVEVFYDLRYENPSTGEIEFFHDLGIYVENLHKDLQKYGSGKFFNPLKLTKRLWALSRIVDCRALLVSLNPLFSANAAALNQVSADTEILEDLTHKANPPLDTMILEALGFKKRVFNHLDLARYNEFVKLTERFFQDWICWRQAEKFPYLEFRQKLHEIRNFLAPIIAEEAKEFLQELDRQGVSCPRVPPRLTQ